MNFSEIPGRKIALRVRELRTSRIIDQMESLSDSLDVRRIDLSEYPETLDIHLVDSVVSVTSTSSAAIRRLTDELRSGSGMVARLSALASDGTVELEAAFFSGPILDMDSIEIGVDEYIESGARRVAGRSVRDVGQWLRDQVVFDFCGTPHFFLIGGPALWAVLDEFDEDGVDEETADDLRLGGSSTNRFCLTGADIRFIASERRLPTGSSVWVATRLTKRSTSQDRAIHLARGDIRFADWTQVGEIRELARRQNELLNDAADSYIRKWDEFGSIEGEIFLDRVRRFGVVKYSRAVAEKNGQLRIQIEEISDAAEEMIRTGQVTEVELIDDVPVHIADEEMSFQDFSKSLMRSEGAGGAVVPASRKAFAVLGLDPEARRMSLQGEVIPEAGSLVMSTAGETAQMKRRGQARARILEGRAANPQLAAIIHPRGTIVVTRSPQKTRALSSFVRQKVFLNPPTLMQERAVEIALNTPDIALIQGPPGTGKTTVIAAILERLNELSAESGSTGAGKVLLSAFQQDAVENMIDRISLNGIPVPKFGRKSGATEDDLTAFERNLASWCADIAEKVRTRYPGVSNIEEEMQLTDLYLQYQKSPSRQLVANIVRWITQMPTELVGVDVTARVTRLAKRLDAQEMPQVDRERKLSAVRQLRIHPESFADDGPEMAERAVTVLEEHLTNEDVDLLDQASRWKSNAKSPSFLNELASLKGRLLLELTAIPEFRVEKFNDEVNEIAEAVIDRLRERAENSGDALTRLMARFLSNLESNQEGMINAISQYSYAFAATAQQSVNREMQRRKGVNDSGEPQSLEYDYVIVDEAARVSPLDLMIPMAQGKKIILLGDHRQLPHIVDDEVARRMESAESDIEEIEWLKTSLFQYLFAERLKRLEEDDGVPRRVTLDVQFRMHPKLGDFVSRNFYERFNQDERFSSGLDASMFSHHLPGAEGKHAIWIDVPVSAGAARRSGTSWIRPAEADAIATQLTAWLRSPESADLTFGVIAFYRSQVAQIRDSLRRKLDVDLDLERRVRIGTVDSFQGMEFDVVLLSIVRTTPSGREADAKGREIQARRTFGHLCLYNRLNVAMSRQRRLLVVVGERALFETDLASEFVPGLVDFLSLTQASSSSVSGM